MAILSGEVQLQQLNDSQTAKVYEFRSAHPNKLSFQFSATASNTTNVHIGWSGHEGGALVNELIATVLPEPAKDSQGK